MDDYYLTKTLIVLLFLLTTVKGKNETKLEVAFENCGGTKFNTKDIINSPNITPDNINFMMDIEISTTLEDLSGDEIFQKYVDRRYERLDCHNTAAGLQVGPCNTVDLCEKWTSHCPPIIDDVSPYCKCPLPKGNFHIYRSIIDIPLKLNPGHYLLRYEMKKDGELIGCTQGNLTST